MISDPFRFSILVPGTASPFPCRSFLCPRPFPLLSSMRSFVANLHFPSVSRLCASVTLWFSFNLRHEKHSRSLYAGNQPLTTTQAGKRGKTCVNRPLIAHLFPLPALFPPQSASQVGSKLRLAPFPPFQCPFRICVLSVFH